jgi:uncharacterized protein YaiI (UPF0178 family)
VVSGDILLASHCLKKGARVLGPSGPREKGVATARGEHRFHQLYRPNPRHYLWLSWVDK